MRTSSVTLLANWCNNHLRAKADDESFFFRENEKQSSHKYRPRDDPTSVYQCDLRKRPHIAFYNDFLIDHRSRDDVSLLFCPAQFNLPST